MAAPLLLLYSLKLPKAPKERVAELLRRLSSGPIAHRGGQPENTLAAFEKAKRRRASAVEVDLEVTKDGHGVLIHDSSVDRTSNGRGLVRNLTLQDLKMLDFGSHWSEEFAGEKIPTLMEAVNKCRELELHMFLEIKTPKVQTEPSFNTRVFDPTYLDQRRPGDRLTSNHTDQFVITSM